MEAVSVMSWDRALAATRVISAGSRRGVTEAPATRCTRPPVRRAPVAPARAPDRNAPPVARAAPPVRRIASDSRMYPVFLLLASAATLTPWTPVESPRAGVLTGGYPHLHAP